MLSQVRILGPIEVELDGGRSARIPRGRTLSLLLYPLYFCIVNGAMALLIVQRRSIC